MEKYDFDWLIVGNILSDRGHAHCFLALLVAFS